MKNLLKDHRRKKQAIKKRLQDFRQVYKRGDEDIFSELCFCILTPQARAVVCDMAIKKLQDKGLLHRGAQEDIRKCLSGVRFPNNKARYLIEAREFFKNGKGPDIKSKIDPMDPNKTRDWLVRNVKGFGYKEASHFLRNIGLGKDMAILDRHILKNLKRYKVIKKIPGALSKKEYVRIESKMREFFKRTNISMEEIDLLFWSMETGMIFK
ncbi:MAG: N-glycosylase/DNA lyase [Candidatus Omnitrophica bacterium]|nr:N-glycosylase/DNA lyase [Candidatus Omnitrophota bacterium]MBU4589667.1 N-glycosylase/DNA lyase [Candidatus Omnitrophota bacterium]